MALSDVFDVEPHDVVVTNEQSTEISTEVISDENDDTIVELDFKKARENQYDLLTMGMASLNTAIKIAAESENPRAIEVLSGLLKTVSEMNKQLIVMNKDKEEVKTEKSKRKTGPQQAIPQIGTQQNVFVGNSADLNKILAERMKELK